MGVVGLVVFVYSFVKGAGILGALIAGVFMGVLVALLIHLGLEKLHEP